MPLYFFDTNDGDRDVKDLVGFQCKGPREAREQALRALPDMAKDVLPDGDRHEVSATVRDGGGKSIFKASLRLTADWIG